MSLKEAIVERANSLNVVRLLLATSVIFVHAWPITGHGSAPSAVRAIGDLAVPGFFCLSGFLIARSRMHLSFGRFLWHRGLRIFPALWVVLLLVAFVGAPLSTVGGGTWSASDAMPFVLSNARLDPYPHFIISGTVDDGAWNGSLWSLSYEFTAYIGAALLLTLAIVRRHARWVLPVVLLLTPFVAWWAYGPGDVSTAFILRSLGLATFFVAGMVMFFWADHVPVDWRLAGLALGVLVVIQLSPLLAMDRLGALPLAYVLLWVGAVMPPRWAQVHDISYGVYIYAYPAQLLVWWLAPELPLWVLVALAVLITVPLAWMSWLLIERPAMRLRNLGRNRAVVETAPSNAPAGHI